MSSLLNRRWRDQVCIATADLLKLWKLELYGIHTKWIAEEPVERGLTNKSGTKLTETSTILKCQFPMCYANLKLIEVTTGNDDFVSATLLFSSIEHSEHDGWSSKEIAAFLRGDECKHYLLKYK